MPVKRKSKRMNGGCDSCPKSVGSMTGEGAKLQALARAAKTAGRAIKKGAQLAVKHRKDIAKAVAAGADIAGLIKPGDKVAGTVSGVANILGRGQNGGLRFKSAEDQQAWKAKNPVLAEKLGKRPGTISPSMIRAITKPGRIPKVGRGGSATVQAVPTAFYPNSALLATGRPQF